MRFNGATASPPWKPGIAAMIACAWARLQWSHGVAAVETRSPWKRATKDCWLQWSHGVAAVETAPEARRPARAVPLQWSHGVAAVETRMRRLDLRSCGRFNGATASPPWKRAAIVTPCRHHGASMEPRRRRRGNVQARLGTPYVPAASMEPRRRRRGNRPAVGDRERGRHASMEPRRRRRGNLMTAALLGKTNGLLQWSHGVAAVETWIAAASQPTALSRFNGATASPPWKRRDRVPGRHRPL